MQEVNPQMKMAGANPAVSSSAGGYGSLLDPYDASTFSLDPSYQFRLDEGLKSVSRSNSASGHGYSGQALKAALRYSQGLASEEFGAAYNRSMSTKQATYNMLTGAVNSGADAVKSTLGQASAGAQNILGAFTSGTNSSANAQSANQTNQGNISAGLASSLGNLASSAYGAYQNKQQQDTNNSMQKDYMEWLKTRQPAAAGGNGTT
jgi:hypothetical protein